MKLYEFDPHTGKYLGSHDAQVDEWQTTIKGETCYIGEANAVWDEPPQQEGYTPYYIGGEWVLKADPTLDELKAAKLAEISEWTEAQITAQLTMQGIALNVNTELFAENYPTGCPVRGYAAGSETKTVFMLTPEQVMRWCADLSMHIGNCKVAGWQKQAEVEAAQTAAEIEDITL